MCFIVAHDKAERVMAEFEGKSLAKRRGSDEGAAGGSGTDNVENSSAAAAELDSSMDGMTEEEKTIAKNLQKRG